MKRRALVVIVGALGLVLLWSTTAAGSGGRPTDAHIAKKCKKKHGKRKCKKAAPIPVTAPPAAAALTDAEVIEQVSTKAAAYCQGDSACLEYGYYYDPDPSHAACDSKSTYTWACYGYNDRVWYFNGASNVATCDFREIVERSGSNGITSHQDLTFGGTTLGGAGWDCAFG